MNALTPPDLAPVAWSGGVAMSAAVSSLDAMEPHVYQDRPVGSVLVDRTWHQCLVRMRHSDGRLNVQLERDGDQYLENVPAESVVLW